LTAILLCLVDKVLDEFSSEKTSSSQLEQLQDYYLKKILVNQLILNQHFFVLRMHDGIPIKPHITKFTSIINELNKVEIKIDDKDKALLLLCSLPSSYKSFMKAIIYESKLTIKVIEVKEHLLNKDKIDK